MTQLLPDPIRIAVLGSGGLGKAAARIIGMKRELRLCAMCDSHGFISSRDGIKSELLATSSSDLVRDFKEAMSQESGSGADVCVETIVEARHCEDPIGELIRISDQLDGVVVALPNLPNEFIPGVIGRFARANSSTVFVDVLKRTRAVELMFELDPIVKSA